jgi:HlyD family secretion protein
LKRKKVYWIVGGISFLVILIAFLSTGRSSGAKVATELVGKKNITEIVSVSGKIQPETEVKISADVSGEIIDMAVKEGDSVKQGQLLLRINPELYETTINQLSANLDNGRASLAGSEAQREKVNASFIQAQANYNRNKKLHDEKVISDQEWDNYRMQYEIAKSDLLAAEKSILASRYNVASMAARLEEGRRNLGRTSIFAPSSGIITNLNSEKGERVVGTAQMAGTEILRISDLNSMEVEVNVNENDIVRIKTGDSADIKVDAYPDRIFKGMVSQIANSAKFSAASAITDQVTSFVVKIHILASSYADLGTGRKQPFRPGMTATADIRTVTKSMALTVPISAVTTRKPLAFGKKASDKADSKNQNNGQKKEETGTWVFIFDNGKSKAVKVKTGIQDLNYFEVTEGLKEGDEVIMAPGMTVAKILNDGDKVIKVDKDKVFDK